MRIWIQIWAHLIAALVNFYLILFSHFRQLPTMVALLKGKTAFSFNEFRQQNLLDLYDYVLGILELLVPSVFLRQHQLLGTILEEYFNFLSVSIYIWFVAFFIFKDLHIYITVLMPPLFGEWWRGIKCYPCSCVRLSVCYQNLVSAQ